MRTYNSVVPDARGRLARNRRRASSGRRAISHARAAAFAALVLAGASACNLDKLLSIETPSRVAEEDLLVPANASLIVASAVADFECALGAYVVASGLAAGELLEGTQTASRWAYDRRSVLPNDAHYSTFECQALGVYTPINTARYTNDQARRALAGWSDADVPNRQRLLATSSALAGYSVLLLAEGFCSGVIDRGPELTTAQLLDSAEVRFTEAIAAAQAAADQNLLNLAYVGRARTRRNQGDLAGAASDAAAVPANFVYNANAATTASRRNNRVAAEGAGISVAPTFRNLTVGGVADTRVRAVDAGRNTSDQINRYWQQQKYASTVTPTPIATWIEAQLILAEARGGAEGILILQNLRTAAGLPGLSAAEIADFTGTLREERRRFLWLQGNRWFDLRRDNLTLTPAVGAAYSKGGTYGDQRCWPLPDVERSANPNIDG